MGELDLGDGTLSYEERGTGRPVVFLHAGGMTRAMWDEQFAHLAGTHRVLRYDARGAGDSSDPPPEFSHREDLKKLLDTLDVERPVLVGCSFGSRVFLDFAVAHPDRVGGLFLSSPGISGMEFRDPYVLGLVAKTAEAARSGDGPGVLESVLRLWVDGPHRTPAEVDPEVRASCRTMLLDNARKGHPAPVIGTELGAIGRVAELRARTLVVTGDLDSTDIFAVADLVERETPHARHARVPGAAHMVNLEQPARFGELLDEFLA
ncbi:alpha/beta hydrolase [Amycolatopsis balhimycina DSM 5908]|uniref:Alpha/beta hydrolase n=1 Tax=Amycolatopsis balhimycina DSM 5908 TaxID=1081091 RepID=A0A428W3C3_AMYBA|nr:alpha/beta fold hydrolase [Amycolatopsis balhimycina]RSM37546.1 alpha/beta hydrolase [Amycolatopsis balhimycina DSM 5908]